MSKIIATLIDAIRAYNVSDCAKDFEGNFTYTISEDLNLWAGREVFTVGQFEEWLDLKQLYSDYHKEAYGIRPRHDYSDYTLSQLQACYEQFASICEENARIEEKREKVAVESFKASARKIMNSGAKDFMTAIRWMMQADDVNPRYRQDVENWMWDHGILYSDYGKSLLKRIYPSR